jgi:molybdopterin converting factor small subunit
LKPEHLLNERVALHPESDVTGRGAYELALLTTVRWVQCPRCRQRFWYALSTETPAAEGWFHGARLRRRLKEEGCEAHGGDAGMTVNVELFGVARLTAGERLVEVAVPVDGRLSDVVAGLARKRPQLLGPVISIDGRSLLDGYVLNLNGRDFVRDLARPVAAGDTVLLVAAAAGG